MADRLTEAFNALRAGGAIFAGRARLTGWSHSIRGQSVSFRLDVSKDPTENPPAHPFLGAYASQKDGEEFMVLVIPVASGTAEVVDQTEPLETKALSPAEPEKLAVSSTNADKRKWSELHLPQRAGMLINDALFRRYIEEQHSYPAATAADADAAMKDIIGIRSKRELESNHDAAATFDRLSRDFIRWKNEPATPLY